MTTDTPGYTSRIEAAREEAFRVLVTSLKSLTSLGRAPTASEVRLAMSQQLTVVSTRQPWATSVSGISSLMLVIAL
jgi:hypothetical protein